MVFSKLVLTTLVALASLAPLGLQAKTTPIFAQTEVVAVSELPPQARSMLQRIHQGGPFRSEKDGVVFFNRERLLPIHPRGYYREYTVRTPGVSHRGARRLVCGGVPTTPDVCYYTADHYASFRKVLP